MVFPLRTSSCPNLASGEARQETFSDTITMARFWMAHYLIPGNQTIQLYRLHLQFDPSVVSIICSNTVLCFSFLFENFEWTWSLFKRLIEKRFSTMALPQTPSRGGDPPSEAVCFRHRSLKTLCPMEFICQIGNSTEERENKYDFHFMSWELWVSVLVANVRLIIFILGNCLHFEG